MKLARRLASFSLLLSLAPSWVACQTQAGASAPGGVEGDSPDAEGARGTQSADVASVARGATEEAGLCSSRASLDKICERWLGAQPTCSLSSCGHRLVEERGEWTLWELAAGSLAESGGEGFQPLTQQPFRSDSEQCSGVEKRLLVLEHQEEFWAIEQLDYLEDGPNVLQEEAAVTFDGDHLLLEFRAGEGGEHAEASWSSLKVVSLESEPLTLLSVDLSSTAVAFFGGREEFQKSERHVETMSQAGLRLSPLLRSTSAEPEPTQLDPARDLTFPDCERDACTVTCSVAEASTPPRAERGQAPSSRLADLLSEDSARRQLAAEALAEDGASADEALLRQLERIHLNPGESPELRRAAGQALSARAPERALRLFIQLERRGQPQASSEWIQLGVVALPYLREACEADGCSPDQLAALTLIVRGAPEDPESVKAIPDLLREAQRNPKLEKMPFSALEAFGPRLRPELEKLTTHADPLVVAGARQVLERLEE